jgi:hypothetical protein
MRTLHQIEKHRHTNTHKQKQNIRTHARKNTHTHTHAMRSPYTARALCVGKKERGCPTTIHICRVVVLGRVPVAQLAVAVVAPALDYASIRDHARVVLAQGDDHGWGGWVGEGRKIVTLNQKNVKRSARIERIKRPLSWVCVSCHT